MVDRPIHDVLDFWIGAVNMFFPIEQMNVVDHDNDPIHPVNILSDASELIEDRRILRAFVRQLVGVMPVSRSRRRRKALAAMRAERLRSIHLWVRRLSNL